MAVEIKIPRLGMTMKEATVVQWLIQSGDPVAEKQIVCLIETDKVTFEVLSPASGLVHPIALPGQRLAVGVVIGYIAGDETELKILQDQMAADQKSSPATITNREQEGDRASRPAADRQPAGSGRIIATPVARKFALEHGMDLNSLSGSGPGGRILLEDVEQALGALGQSPVERNDDLGTEGQQTPLLTTAQEIPIRGIRKIISENMMLSLTNQAQITLHTEASAIHLRDLRLTFKNSLAGEATPVSYNAIIVKAAALALRRYPRLNATVEGQNIKIWEQIHIGVAMDFGEGLLVPKIRNADTKPVRVISMELNELAEKAAKKRLLPDDLQAGTFTITNLGSSDIDHFTPIINPPESAILGVGRIIEKPWVREGLVVAEPRLGLSLTFDHRIIDGALAGQFLKTIKDNLEETRLML
ncbi:MAG: 2-oxo acid dehydrogenase subunit E2 [Deltaproteobacteria bacterium]|nr:2-oxo acid dehydrogenase subunit E2 [Deltaproteobacteria bacterium]